MIEEHSAIMRPLAETRALGSTMARWDNTLPVETTKFQLAAPGAYRLESDDLSGVKYRPVGVNTVPDSEVPPSKRCSVISEQETALDSNISVLEVSTRSRNRELQQHLEAIDARGRRFEAQLRVEAEDRLRAVEALQQHFDDGLARGLKAEEDGLMAIMESFHGTLIPAQEARMAASAAEIDVFVKETVPTVIDRQSGIVARKLQKAHDTFAIENAKIAKRESKIVERFEGHTSRTAQSFEDERATRRSKFTLLREAAEDVERADDRLEEQHTAAAHNSLLALSAQLEAEKATREREDNTLLDSMMFSQRKLQQTILEAFGAQAE
ncbi:hypothetical protein M885DRAFT_458759 [Pelagophyceae sp. CCMP2097]|nr:hypothetical protein M885DRAFT_458759 [Pelagophyceae sp. CCMP2097]|mmetsp:Transcript_1744/g.6367  ORF Transcript_1744/g.6367 Transcript_1744/m.6367 type:complete len:325 (-) Transcript_1744:126-1100(-)